MVLGERPKWKRGFGMIQKLRVLRFRVSDVLSTPQKITGLSYSHNSMGVIGTYSVARDPHIIPVAYRYWVAVKDLEFNFHTMRMW